MWRFFCNFVDMHLYFILPWVNLAFGAKEVYDGVIIIWSRLIVGSAMRLKIWYRRYGSVELCYFSIPFLYFPWTLKLSAHSRPGKQLWKSLAPDSAPFYASSRLHKPAQLQSHVFTICFESGNIRSLYVWCQKCWIWVVSPSVWFLYPNPGYLWFVQ